MRRRGHDIVTIDKVGIDRYGHSVTYANYVYHAPDETDIPLDTQGADAV